MTISITITGETPAAIKAELGELLRMYPSDLVEKFTVKPSPQAAGYAESIPTQPRRETLAAALDAAGEVVEVTQVTGSDGAAAALIYHDDPTKPAPTLGEQIGSGAVALPTVKVETRGRKPGTKNKPKNSDVQPAVANNTGSAPAVQETPAAEGVTESDATGATATVAAPVATAPTAEPTAAQMRASLQAMCEAAPTPNEGQQKAREILALFEVRKVGEVKPEQHAAIIAKAVEATAAYKQAAE